ncbi:acetyltransferase [Photobacterium jeanii]|uniref:Acetyltransferase n=1 Tax=Photobacterium jeanii TaxID=858640 RepID=A0A178KMK7_9GAMM|nr:GNAT family N-acetyltransferase [Photobacterium jeanii]OAN17913.1 acetyltransferase [Photobacterium jeanii]PST92418.1 N-acetyltransferase [Photobacterium jeanii]
MKVELAVSPSSEDLKVISDGIAAFNEKYLPNDGEFDSGFRFGLFVKNDNGEIVGGLQASVIWSYCVLELLWLSEETRGTGIGTELMGQLEAFAKEKGLQQIRTETLDFQAKPFYEKLGFRVYGVIEGSPENHTTYFLVKDI